MGRYHWNLARNIVGDSWKDAAGNCYEAGDDARKMKAAREKYGTLYDWGSCTVVKSWQTDVAETGTRTLAWAIRMGVSLRDPGYNDLYFTRIGQIRNACKYSRGAWPLKSGTRTVL